MLTIGWLRGVRFFERDGTLGAGLFAGCCLRRRIVLIFRGLLLTSASRRGVSLTRRFSWRSLLSVLGERLRVAQWGGLGLSLPAWRSRSGCRSAMWNANVLFGDLLIVVAARYGGHHADREGDRAAESRAGKRRWPTRWRCRSRFWVRVVDFPAKPLTRVPGPWRYLWCLSGGWVVGLTFRSG